MSADKMLIIDKPLGVTPLQVIDALKKKVAYYRNETISYAGRLDPMAHGVLLLLIGDENKKRESYLHLDKLYQVEMLFGFSTDTYDLLGKVSAGTNMEISQEKIERVLPRFMGKRKQFYPPFSSQPVNGKPLFYWARENRLSEITIPSKEIEIYSNTFLSMRMISGSDLLEEIKKRIALVSGDFRQKDILTLWEKAIDTKSEYPIITFSIFCSSGTYVRSIAHDMGKYIGCGALAFDIYRTEVGKYTIRESKLVF